MKKVLQIVGLLIVVVIVSRRHLRLASLPEFHEGGDNPI